MSVAVSDPTSDLWRSIVFMQTNFPSGASFDASGVMVGPNDVLTASHALYMADQGGAATSVTVTPANWGTAPFGQVTSNSFHYYSNYDPTNSHLLMPGDGTPALAGSELDIGIIDLSTALGNQTGWMQLDPGFSGGTVNVTGFPAASGWNMMNDSVSASQSPTDSIVSYSGVTLNFGSSGGPVWYQGSDGGHVVGVVSTSSWGAAVQGTYNDLANWIGGNDYMIGGSQGVATAPSADTTTQPPTDTTQPSFVDDTPSPTESAQPPADGAPAHQPPPGLIAPNLYDFNGDGNADMLLRNVHNGAVEIHNLSGTSVTGSAGTNLSAGMDWSVADTGDFNGDGRGDILWRHDSGTVAVWTMSGASVINSSAVGQNAASQHVAGVGDFNGDHKSDILWRGDDGIVSTWQMDDHAVSGGGAVGQMSADWKLAGVGDFSGDQKADVLWRNDNGTLSMWLMDGTNHTATGVIANAPNDWHVAGIGDFNGDQHSDIAWQQDAGAVSIWLMDGDHVAGGWGTVTGMQAGWKLVGVGDFNHDQRSDLL